MYLFIYHLSIIHHLELFSLVYILPLETPIPVRKYSSVTIFPFSLVYIMKIGTTCVSVHLYDTAQFS